jgi:hypothetical protein
MGTFIRLYKYGHGIQSAKIKIFLQKFFHAHKEQVCQDNGDVVTG